MPVAVQGSQTQNLLHKTIYRVRIIKAASPHLSRDPMPIQFYAVILMPNVYRRRVTE